MDSFIINRTFYRFVNLGLKGNQVVVTLAREGKLPVDLAAVAKMQLEVRAGFQRGLWPLIHVDPGFHEINGRNGTTVFRTGIEPEKTGPVMARLIGGEGQALTKMFSPSETDKSSRLANAVQEPQPERDPSAVEPGDKRMGASTQAPGDLTPKEYSPDEEERIAGLIAAGTVGAVVVIGAAAESGPDGHRENPCRGVIVTGASVAPADTKGVISWQAKPHRNPCVEWVIVIYCGARAHDSLRIRPADSSSVHFDPKTETYSISWIWPIDLPPDCDLSVKVLTGADHPPAIP